MAQASALRAHLATKSLIPTTLWLDSFLASQRSSTPLAALKQTALFRLLSSDFTESLEKSATLSLPHDVHDTAHMQRKLEGSIPVQLLSVEDVGCSRWNQIEAIEAAERGETTKGREIIRTVPGEESAPAPAFPSRGPHIFILQDAKGTQVYAFDVAGIESLSLSSKMGMKMILRNVQVARAVLLLEPSTVLVLGGRIEAIHKAWQEERKVRLHAAIEGSDEKT